jgi:hypothetical protein
MANREEMKSEGGKDKESSPEILKVLTGNPSLMAWLVFLGFGGALLTFYYTHIHYFPEIEWKESFTYLAALSLLGGGAALTYSLLLFIPGVIWSEFLIFDTELRGQLCYQGSNGEEPCYWNVLIHLALPFTAFMTVVHVAKYFGRVEPAAFFGMAGLIFYYFSDFREILATLKCKLALHTQAENPSILAKAVLTASFAAFTSLVSLLFLYRFVNPESKSLPLLSICTLVVVGSNLLVAVQFRNKLPRAVVTGVLAALVLLFCGEILSEDAAHSIRIMEKFGLGGDSTAVTLVLNEKGRELLEGVGVKPSPQAEAPLLSLGIQPFSSSKYWTIEGARILSRLGNEYLIVADGRHITVPKDSIISWATAQQKPSGSGTVSVTGVQVALDLASALLGLLIGWLLAKAKADLRKRRKKEFWQRFCATTAPVADSTFDARIDPVLTELRRLFDELELHGTLVTAYASESELILSIGAESTTAMDRLAIAKLRCIQLGHGDGKSMHHEHCFIYSRPGEKACTLVIAGSSMACVWAGARYITSHSFLADRDVREAREFGLWIQSNVVSGVPRDIKRVGFQSL